MLSNPRRAVVLTAAAAVVLSPLVLSQAAEASTPSCFGKKATITSSKSNKTITGTKGNDVIVVTGKNDTIKGNGGKDRICAGDVKKVTIGKAASSVQVKSGTVVGGAGNDTIVQKGATTKKSTFSGGGGINKFTVPSKEIKYVTITPGVLGDLLNGSPIPLGLPTSGPELTLYAYDELLGPVTAPTVAHDVVGYDFSRQYINTNLDADEYVGRNYTYFYVTGAYSPAGSTIASWSFNPGDGSPLRHGTGLPPAQLRIAYPHEGTYTASITVTDSQGRSASRSMPVAISTYAQVDLGSPSGTAPTTIPVTYKAPVGATPRAWAVLWGDGSPLQTGVGAPPASLSHTYPTGSFDTYIAVSDSSGDIESSDASVYVPGGTSLLVDPWTRSDDPAAPLVEGPAALSPTIGDDLYLDISDPFLATSGGTSFDIDWGDGSGLTHGSYTGDYYSHEYRLLGTHTVTVTAQNGATTVVKTMTVTVQPQPIVVSVSVPTTIPQGPQTIGISSTPLPAGTHWEIGFSDGNDPIFGSGPLPTSVRHTFNPANASGAGSQEAFVYLYAPSGRYYSAYSYTAVLGPYPAITNLGFGQGYSSTYQGWTPIRAGRGGYASGSIVASQGAKLTGATVSFGDGSPAISPRGFQSGYFNSYETSHAYATPGDYVVTGKVTDSKKRSASTTSIISVAGSPTIAGIADTYTATAGTPLTISGIVGAAGANDQITAWSVDWSDSGSTTPFTNAVGPLPTSLTHTFATAGTYTAYVGFVTSHELAKSKKITITVS